MMQIKNLVAAEQTVLRSVFRTRLLCIFDSFLVCVLLVDHGDRNLNPTNTNQKLLLGERSL